LGSECTHTPVQLRLHHKQACLFPALHPLYPLSLLQTPAGV
jgi:hypothetical protein